MQCAEVAAAPPATILIFIYKFYNHYIYAMSYTDNAVLHQPFGISAQLYCCCHGRQTRSALCISAPLGCVPNSSSKQLQ